MLLTKDVFLQFKPTIKDYLDNNDFTNREDITMSIFKSFAKFKKAIKDIFRNLDKKREVEQKLIKLY